jgi:soluble lytic murein transglycosylase-like protein
VGTSGEVGLVQILPTTGAWVARKLNLYDYDMRDPRTNLTLGATYLRWLIAEHGSVERALMAYNAGPQFETRAPVAARGYADRIRLAMGR